MSESSFSVGSIWAEFKLQTENFMAGAKKVVEAGKKAADEIDARLNTVGKNLKIDASGLGNSLNGAINQVDTFVKKVEKELSTATKPLVDGAREAGKQAGKELGTAVDGVGQKVADSVGGTGQKGFSMLAAGATMAAGTVSVLGGAVMGVATVGFQGLMWAGEKAFSVIAGAIKAPFKLLGVFKDSLLSLKGLLAAVMTWELIQRANRFEYLQDGFKSLTSSVGELADVMLTKLRKATNGTISDMELMQSTNNAVLLQVVKSADQWAEMANAAKRLGKAMGRSPTDALNDITIGVGRQSRMILDNLGIIVRVEDAYDSYAATLGKTAEKLTDVERREAFMIATMDSVRKKLRDLGPEVLTTGGNWSRLTASIANFWDQVAMQINGSRLPLLLSSLVDKSRKPVVEFARMIMGVGNDIWDYIESTIAKLSAGQMSFGEVFRGFLSDITIVVTQGFGIVVEALKVGASAFIPAAVKTLVWMLQEILAQVMPSIRGTLSKALAEAETLYESIRAKLKKSPISEAMQQQFFDLSAGEWEKSLNNLEQRLGVTGQQRESSSTVVEGVFKEMITSLDEGEKTIGQKIQTLANTLRQSGSAFGAAFGDGAMTQLQEFKRRMESKIKDLGDLKVDPSVQSIANGFSKVVVWADKFLAKLPQVRAQWENLMRRDESYQTPFTTLFADNSDQQIVDKVEAVVFAMRRGVEITNTWARAVKDFFKIKRIDTSTFSQNILKYQAEIVKMQDELASVGQSDSVKSITEINRVLGELLTQTKDQGQIEVLKNLIAEFENTGRALDAAKAIHEFSGKLLELRKNIAQFKSEGASIPIDQLVEQYNRWKTEIESKAAEAPNIGKFRETMAELDKLKPALAAGNDRWFSEELKKINDEFDRAGMTDYQKRIAGLRDELDKALAKGKEIPEELYRVKAALDDLESKEWKVKVTTDISEAEAMTKSLEDKIKYGHLAAEEIPLAKLYEDLDRYRAIADEKEISRIQTAITELDKKLGAYRFGQLFKNIATTFGNAILEGFMRGEKFSKTWANFVAQIFQQQMQKAIEGIGNTLARVMSMIFQNAAGGGAASIIGGGLVTVGAILLQTLASKKNSTVDDFTKAINSSEAVRGLVAGPTNFAIAKVGSQLKEALFTTEILLERIARAIEGGVSSSPRDPSNSRNMIYPLMTSTG